MLKNEIGQGSLRLMNKQDLDLVLHWRNHRDVKQYMYNREKISKGDHYRWFDSLVENSLKTALIFEWNSIPSGFIGFTIYSYEKISDWGFYLSPDLDRNSSVNKGIGKSLGKCALQYAFESLNLHKVFGQVIDDNDSSKKFHESMGFSQEGCLKEHYFDGNNYINIICYGLTKDSWLKQIDN